MWRPSLPSATFYTRSKELLEAWLPHSKPVPHTTEGIWKEARDVVGVTHLVYRMAEQREPYVCVKEGDVWCYNGEYLYHAYFLYGAGVVVPLGDLPSESHRLCAAALDDFDV